MLCFAALSSAVAAQPYGPCCADLEARVAELEEMAARKGNAKVSLEVSGLVNTAILSWDDGAEDNAYVVTNDNQRSRFRFIGSAKISPEWEAGYRIEVGLRSANSKLVDQFSDQGFGERNDFDLRDSVWYLKSQHYGTLFLGTTFAATDRIANSNLTQTAKFAQYAAPEDTGLSMYLRSAVTGDITARQPHVAAHHRRRRRPAGREPAWLLADQVRDAHMERVHRRRDVGGARLLGHRRALPRRGRAVRRDGGRRLPAASRGSISRNVCAAAPLLLSATTPRAGRSAAR